MSPTYHNSSIMIVAVESGEAREGIKRVSPSFRSSVFLWTPLLVEPFGEVCP